MRPVDMHRVQANGSVLAVQHWAFGSGVWLYSTGRTAQTEQMSSSCWCITSSISSAGRLRFLPFPWPDRLRIPRPPLLRRPPRLPDASLLYVADARFGRVCLGVVRFERVCLALGIMSPASLPGWPSGCLAELTADTKVRLAGKSFGKCIKVSMSVIFLT